MTAVQVFKGNGVDPTDANDQLLYVLRLNYRSMEDLPPSENPPRWYVRVGRLHTINGHSELCIESTVIPGKAAQFTLGEIIDVLRKIQATDPDACPTVEPA
jgi:hypothetical protein